MMMIDDADSDSRPSGDYDDDDDDHNNNYC